MASESIAKLLGESPELLPLAQRLSTIKRLQKRYRTLVPESLAEASRVCAIDGTTVVVCAASGPVASALRHLAPRLLEGLRSVRGPSKSSRDQELTSMRIEVQVDKPAPARPVPPRPAIPRDKISDVAEGLSDSPLKEALQRMGRNDQSITRMRSKR